MPMERFRGKFGDLNATEVTARLHELVAQFLHDAKEGKRPEGRRQKRSEG